MEFTTLIVFWNAGILIILAFWIRLVVICNSTRQNAHIIREGWNAGVLDFLSPVRLWVGKQEDRMG